MKRIIFAAAAACVLMLASGCHKETPPEITAYLPAEEAPETKNIVWYYFTQNGYAETENISSIPRVPFLPWTEALRVSSSAETGTGGQELPLLLVNRLGLMAFTPDPVLYTDQLLFSDSTADSIVSIENNAVLHLYKSSFFNPNIANAETPFLVSFTQDSSEFLPVLSTSDLGLSPQAQSIDLFYTGAKWVSAFKTVTGNQITFDYMTFTSDGPLITMTALDKKTAIKKQTISADEYKRSQMPRPVTQAPERLKKLLSPIPETVPYQVSCRHSGGTGNMLFVQNAGGAADMAEGIALLGGTWTAALFTDGTFYFEGALPGRPLAKNGEPVALRLPRLPAGFVYTSFIISGARLQVGWEEVSFFETGRSGFLTVNLDMLF